MVILNASLLESFLQFYVVRYITSLHVTWFVNSAAHMFGDRPYKPINPVENIWVSLFGYGEGYHNYHHAFPNDYRASEHGHGFNVTRHFIELMAKFGHVYNMRTASDTIVNMSMNKMSQKGSDTLLKQSASDVLLSHGY